MNGVLGHHAELLRNTRLGTSWTNEMNFGMNHAPRARSITRPVNLQSNMLSLYYNCLLQLSINCIIRMDFSGKNHLTGRFTLFQPELS